MSNKTVEKYALSLRLVHWLMSISIFTLIAVGWYMQGLDPTSSYKYQLYDLHKSFGVLILCLWFLRVGLRKATSIPELPKGIHKKEQKLSKYVHGLLYIGLLIVPVSGYIMSDAGDYGVKLFGIVLPDFFDKNEWLAGIAHTVHEYAPYVLLGLVFLHVAGVIKHRFFEPKENDVLSRML